MIKGFKDFILRGNVVELATAVIVGAAFTGIVTAFTSGIINPLLAAIPTGSGDCAPATPADGNGVSAPVSVCGLGFKVTDNDATFLDFGGLIAAIINFLIVAAVIYFIIIVPYNKLSALGKKPNQAEATEISLLTEIRDFLAPDDSTSAAKEQAQSMLPPHLHDPSGPPTGGDPGITQGVGTPTTRFGATGSDSYAQRPQYTDPAPSGPIAPGPIAPGPFAPGPSTPPEPRSGPGAPHGPGPSPYPGAGGPTPSPAPGTYPPPGNYPPAGGQPGNYPPGSYPPPYPGDDPPDGPGRHSR